MTTPRTSTRAARLRAATLAVAVAAALVPAAAAAALTQPDPRAGLAPGTQQDEDGAAFTDPLRDAETAAEGMELLAERSKPAYVGAAGAFNYSNINSDIAFQGDYAFSGNYRGFGVYDVSDPGDPVLRTTVNCPGGQGDVSVHGDLLFMSVESGAGRVDCSTSPTSAVFRGVRVFDISDPLAPVQVAGVQTCRGSHTHTLVTQPGVEDRVWVYNSGTAGVRAATQLAGCRPSSTTDPLTSAYSIDVIEVPLADPAAARVVGSPRVMASATSVAGLNPGGTQPTLPADDPRASAPGNAAGGQRVSATAACHDITAYPAIGLAAGACQGDGLLLDISDAANPRRVTNVTDPNFAYWHSATFNDAGTKVVFTDEWGGGGAARCQPGDPTNWGANAIFDIVRAADGTPSLQWRSYYKIPGVQAENEVCVAHNGNLVPVPGRDVMVQAWYEGGTSVFDFTDSANPEEIGFFDRGPYHPTVFHQGGYWSTYWYNGAVFGNEIFLGLDTWGLTGTAALSEDEIAAAAAARVPVLNAQSQEPVVHEPSFTLVRATSDQAVRAGALSARDEAGVARFVDRAEGLAARDARAASATLRAKAGQLKGVGQEALAEELRRLADEL
ncbi:LVIVD repeat-containing protein [Aquipuribacter hungaricus]|uniref:LVIVD repeat-containing protein n=2 Tax=Aquipuribacter hungaricus TaxID=545624 RepID=A0ABV7WDM6_9MICO